MTIPENPTSVRSARPLPIGCFPMMTFHHWSSQAAESLPAIPRSSFAENLIARSDNACIITGHKTSIQACHLCPRSESDWFLRNRMDWYSIDEVTRPKYAIDDSTNGITLRSDLHTEFGANSFVFARKSETGYIRSVERC
jgi:HNH endonuclease